MLNSMVSILDERDTISLKRYLDVSSTMKKNVRIPQHVSYHSNENTIKGHRIIVNNEGTFCPNNCTSEVNIIDENNKTVWNHKSSDSYVMKPAVFTFNKSDTYGFVFKIWEHEHEVINFSFASDPPSAAFFTKI